MHVAKPLAQFPRLGLNLKHCFDAEAQRRCKQTWRNEIPAGPQVSNVKKQQTYIQQTCGTARGLRHLVDTASFIIWTSTLRSALRSRAAARVVAVSWAGCDTMLSAIGGCTACGIPLIRSANGNGNGIPFNGIPFPFVSIKVYLAASVNCRKR